MKAVPYPPMEWVRRAWPVVSLPSYERDRRTIAYHEAGHAVLGVLIGLPMGAAHVYEDGGGKVELPTPSSVGGTERAIPPAVLESVGAQIASMYVGGTMAELLLHGIEIHGELNLDTPDWRNARAVLREALGHDLALYYCQRGACAMLAANWDWVKAVAEALADAGTLSGDDIRLLCPLRGG